MSKAKAIFRAPAVRTPTLKQLGDLASRLGMSLSDQDLHDYQGFLNAGLEGYNALEKYPEPLPPVKYPRAPGYQPPVEENHFNAWYYKTDIKGAESGLLAGKKVAIKDNVAVGGVPMMNGTKLLEGYTPEFDATVVTRILDAGGHILGKAACEDMCFCGSSFTNSKGPILNFHDKTRSAGGSSGGSAVLVAAGEVDMAIGGDQGGSIRLPACWNGVVGLKPTWGLVPYTGAVSLEPSCDHLGPITRTVKDCALMLEAIAGYDNGLDGRQPVSLQVPKYTEALTGKLNGMKIGIVTEGFEETESDVEAMVREAALKLKAAGARVEDTSIPMQKDSHAIWGALCMEGGYQQMIESGGVSFGLKGFQPTSLHDHFYKALKANPDDLPPTVKYLSLYGLYMKESYGNRYYMKAVNVTRTLTEEYNKALAKYDVLIMPTIRFKAPKLPPQDISVKEHLEAAFANTANTVAADATGHPAMTINAGFSSEKLPVGMMIIGKHFDESTILKVGHAYEQIRDA